MHLIHVTMDGIPLQHISGVHRCTYDLQGVMLFVYVSVVRQTIMYLIQQCLKFLSAPHFILARSFLHEYYILPYYIRDRKDSGNTMQKGGSSPISVCLVITNYVFLHTSLEVLNIVNSNFLILLFVHDLLIVLIFCLPS